MAIEVVEWTDVTNIQEWTSMDDIEEWSKDGGYLCRNVGFVVYEDNNCVVLAARVAPAATPPQAGLYERIPKTAITNRYRLVRTTRRDK